MISESSAQSTASLSRETTIAMAEETKPQSCNSEPEDNSNVTQTQKNTTISPRIVSDAILGLSDGLTVPFALTAGLSALGTSRLVVLGGLAELTAGAISMGLGGFVGAKSEAESYQATSRACDALIKYSPTETSAIVRTHFQAYGIPPDSAAAASIEDHFLLGSPTLLKDFLMRHHFDVSAPPDNRPYISAITLGIAYILGGIVPLIPYFFLKRVNEALFISIALMAVVLVAFGYVKTGVVRGWKGRDNVLAALMGSLQMLLVGAAAAGAAVGLVRAVNSSGAGGGGGGGLG